QTYRMDTIKIDRSIVTGLCDDAAAMSICTTISQFARNRNYGVIAEGVVNARQEAFLVSCGVTELQGYRYGMPTKKSTMIARVRESQERRLGVGVSGTQAVAA
ncbi:MAG: EAL domain-containing protein, partial [Vulcanimicrobiaceae bacterium]